MNNLLEGLDNPLAVLPGVVVLGILRQNDLGEPEFAARLL